MQTAHISTAPEDYLTTAELAEARTMYERLCARIRRIISGRIARHGTADASSHWQAIRDRVTASRRSATADDAQVFELVREWRNIAALADRETSGPPRATARLLELADKMTASYETARVAARSTAARDELLHTDPSGDRLHAAPPRGKHGTLLFIRPGEGEVYVPTAAVDALRAALKGSKPTYFLALAEGVEPALFSTAEGARDYCDDVTRADARGRYWDWMPEQDGVQEQWWTHEDNDQPVSATGASVTVLRVDADLAAEQPAEPVAGPVPIAEASTEDLVCAAQMLIAGEKPEAEPDLPSTTAVGRNYLRRFATETVYVWLGSPRPGNGVSTPALERLLNDGLVVVGDPEPDKGRPIALTDLGRAVLAAHPETTSD